MNHFKINPAIKYDDTNQVNWKLIREFLCNVAPLYPNFDTWFHFKFRRNLSAGERQIVIAYENNNIVGVALLKKSEREKKICTLYVSPMYRGLKVGNELLDISINKLDSDKTIITASAERNEELYPLLKSKGFTLTDIKNGYYRKDCAEYFYQL